VCIIYRLLLLVHWKWLERCLHRFLVSCHWTKNIGEVVNEVCETSLVWSKVRMLRHRMAGKILSLQFQSARSFPNNISGWEPGLGTAYSAENNEIEIDSSFLFGNLQEYCFVECGGNEQQSILKQGLKDTLYHIQRFRIHNSLYFDRNTIYLRWWFIILKTPNVLAVFYFVQYDLPDQFLFCYDLLLINRADFPPFRLHVRS